MRGLVLALALIPTAADAELYGSIGLGWTHGYTYAVPVNLDNAWIAERHEWPGAKARIEVGIRHNGFALFAEHISSADTSKDPGVNFVGIKYEIAR